MNELNKLDCNKLNSCGWNLENFPYIEEDFDMMNNYQQISKLITCVNKIIDFCNGELTENIKKYIDMEFNNIMMDSMYESNTETLILYLTKKGVDL